MTVSNPPTDRSQFGVGIICALPLEATAVSALFDTEWDSHLYGKAVGDTNAYSTGSIGRHNVVLVHMAGMGKIAAATAAANLRASFEGVQLAIVVGVCGAIPLRKQPDMEIHLGDVIISEGLVQYDFGRRYSSKQFARKDTPHDNLPRPSPEIRAVLAKLQVEQGRRALHERTVGHLLELREKLYGIATYPGATEDKLFEPIYRHKHHVAWACVACANNDDVCDSAMKLTCDHLQCDEGNLVPRQRLSEPFNPAIHFGLIASGDTVMKSGVDRDNIATRDQVIAFEMEGAGVWELFRSVLVIKAACDYADSHKSKNWQGYAAATAAGATKGFLEHWTISPRVDSLGSLPQDIGSEATKSSAQKEKETNFLKSLRKSPYRDRKDRNPDRIPGTCEWFVAHRLFQIWEESRSSTLLWVSADPGCGKSVLAKHLVDTVLPTDRRAICYFFFKDDFEDQRSITTALCCILSQLFQARRDLLSEGILEQFEIQGDNFSNSFSELWDALITTTETHDAGEVIILLDAIDECEDEGRILLEQALCKFYGSKRDSNLKFLLTTRPYGKIKRGLRPLDIPELPVIHLSGESDAEMHKISAEIEIFVRERVRNIRAKLRLGHEEQQLMLERLLQIPNRTYLWAQLTLELIESEVDIDKRRIVDVTTNLPNSVYDAYERILSKSRNTEQAKKLLHIIVGAARPLTVQEMGVALRLKESHRSCLDLDIIPEERFRDTIRDLCGLFVTILDSRLYLIHQTAKEFLIQGASRNSLQRTYGTFGWKHSLSPQQSHHILFRICVWFLQLREVEMATLDAKTDLRMYVDAYPLLDYAATFWTLHLQGAHINADTIMQLLRGLCDTGLKDSRLWFKIYWFNTHGEIPRDFSALMVASYFGLDSVVKELLDDYKGDLDFVDGKHERSALSWAAERGSVGVVKLLLKGRRRSFIGIHVPSGKGAEVNSIDVYMRTPLTYAAWNGHLEVASLLLRKGAAINAIDEFGATPLLYATYNAKKPVVDLLLAQGAKTHSGENIIMAFCSAAGKGQEPVMRLLLENGTDPNARRSDGRNLISWAASHGYKAALTLLIESGADINRGDYENGQTAIHHAIKYGHKAAVGLLVEYGADSKLGDKNGQTPLHFASSIGEHDIVQILLNKDSQPPLELRDDVHMWTPLICAAAHGYTRIVRLLLDSGADIEANDLRCGRTPLSWAARKGHDAVAELLLNRGAELESLDSFARRTPLSWAAFSGYEAVAKLLLERGAFIEHRDHPHRFTPLLLAVRNGHQAVVKLLLDKGADVDSEDTYSGRHPIAWAAVNGYEAILRLFLEKGVLTEQRCGFKHQTPLSLAVENNRMAAVLLLLDNKADIEARDIYSGTPLCCAAKHGHASMVKILLERGANPEAKDMHGLTPLSLALANNHEAAVLLLLDNKDFETRKATAE
ncbi:ankyrin repeat-containing domain protein [Aspergillus sergii]|uniref:Ankyrin repeat-containing domain protein n=1 Tax=Aspergillus sergii TaxID=1034303 RepID=A0A5N6XEX5_9EURO|nr:ankyrin repeat-containing domain protein [Aspergillus sergii]